MARAVRKPLRRRTGYAGPTIRPMQTSAGAWPPGLGAGRSPASRNRSRTLPRASSPVIVTRGDAIAVNQILNTRARLIELERNNPRAGGARGGPGGRRGVPREHERALAAPPRAWVRSAHGSERALCELLLRRGGGCD